MNQMGIVFGRVLTRFARGIDGWLRAGVRAEPISMTTKGEQVLPSLTAPVQTGRMGAGKRFLHGRLTESPVSGLRHIPNYVPFLPV
jgi:hypothetical protein